MVVVLVDLGAVKLMSMAPMVVRVVAELVLVLMLSVEVLLKALLLVVDKFMETLVTTVATKLVAHTLEPTQVAVEVVPTPTTPVTEESVVMV